MIEQKLLTQDEIDMLMESMDGAHEIPNATDIPRVYYRIKYLGHLDGRYSAHILVYTKPGSEKTSKKRFFS
jgi:hypothetical protein